MRRAALSAQVIHIRVHHVPGAFAAFAADFIRFTQSIADAFRPDEIEPLN